MLWAELNTRYDFKFLFTRKLTQDSIENLFSVVRYKGGNNICPDASKFRSSLRFVLTNQLLTPSDDSNCEIDAATFLVQKKDIFKKHKTYTIALEKNFPDETSSMLNIDDLPQKNADNYVLGWACSNIVHERCKEALTIVVNDGNLNNLHIDIKKYNQDSKLLYPTPAADFLACKIKEVYNNNFQTFLNENVCGVRKKLIECTKKENIMSLCNICEECYTVLATKFFNVIFKSFVCHTNDSFVSNMKTNNKKLKKITHN